MPTKPSGPVCFLDAEASLEQVWTLFWHAQQIPTYQLWHTKSARASHTTRKPILLLRLSGLLLLRHAERQILGLLFQEPPRLAACPT